jgi:hypothetical protein
MIASEDIHHETGLAVRMQMQDIGRLAVDALAHDVRKNGRKKAYRRDAEAQRKAPQRKAQSILHFSANPLRLCASAVKNFRN